MNSQELHETRKRLRKKFGDCAILTPLIRVESSNLHSIGYDRETERLNILFHTGLLYQYRDVPSKLILGLERALSKGEYFHQWIKDQFPYRRIAVIHKLPDGGLDLLDLLEKSVKALAKPKSRNT